MAGVICIGTDFIPDSSSKVLRVRGPRAATWPSGQGAATVSNGVLMDAQGGLWVAQTPQWTQQQTFASGTNPYINIPVGTAGSTWWQGGTGNQYEPATFAWNPIVNPSGFATAAYTVEMEWEVWADNGAGNWAELWGWYQFAADQTVTPAQGFNAIATDTGGTDGNNNAYHWRNTIKRTEQFTLAAGTQCVPQMRWLFKAVSIGGFSGSIPPNLRYWRASMYVTGFLLSPVPVA